MHAQTSRSRPHDTTMTHRAMNPRTQKEKNRRFSAHYRKPTSPFSSLRSSRSPRSPPYHKAHVHHSLQASPSSHEPHPTTMPIIISTTLCRWLLEKGFEGYIKVIEAPTHPDALEIAKKLNVDITTNATFQKKLDLSTNGEKHFGIPPTKTLVKYFREYSVSAKAYRTKEILEPFFRRIAKFLLEVGCVHSNAYGMPKQKAGVIIDTFEGHAVDWGVIMGPTLREGLHAYQAGKKLRPIIQQYLTVLFPPHGLPAPP